MVWSYEELLTHCTAQFILGLFIQHGANNIKVMGLSCLSLIFGTVLQNSTQFGVCRTLTLCSWVQLWATLLTNSMVAKAVGEWLQHYILCRLFLISSSVPQAGRTSSFSSVRSQIPEIMDLLQQHIRDGT